MWISKEEIYKKVADKQISMDEAMKLLEKQHWESNKVQYKEYELSEGQKALWMVYKLSPNNYAYNVPMAYYINSDVDLNALRSAFQLLINRHYSLRTVFKEENGEVLQRIVDQHIHFSIKELKNMNELAIRNEIDREAKKTFDLENGPVIKVTVFTGIRNKSILLINIHHIVFDGMSIGIMLKELQGLYGAVKNGREHKESDSCSNTASYEDFVEWQKKLLKSEEGRLHKEYWMNQLSGDIPIIDLPIDHSRTEAPSLKGANCILEADIELSKGIKELALNENISTFSIMLSAFKILLHHYSNQKTICVGTPMSGRSDLSFENTIGYFINTVAVKSNISGELSFKSFAENVQNTTLEALEHSDYPFFTLSRELGRARLFHQAFYFQNWVNELAENNSNNNHLVMEPCLEIHQEGEFDLTMEVLELQDKYVLCIKYNPDIFEGGTIKRISSHYIQILKEASTTPDKKISEFSMISEDERRGILIDLNNTSEDYPKEKCIYELFEEQAQKTPQSIAAIYKDKKLSYKELDERASIIGEYLNLNGVGRGKTVGIFTERSLEMLIALLGVLKSGAAYVPLDPIYPEDRLSYMIDDTRLSTIITQSGIEEKLPACRSELILIDKDWDKISDKVKTQRDITKVKVKPEDIAYIIYTSGSTGKPKGVQVYHKGLSNFMNSMSKYPGFTSKDHILALTTICFDIAGLELYLPLIKGGIVEIVPSDITRDGFMLKEKIESNDANVIQATPATWQMLLAAEWENRKPLKILCGGEALSRKLADELLSRSSEVWNLFGPTETTIWSTVSKIEKNKKITIGRPIANTQIYILDSSLNIVPAGVSGELFIGGDGLAKGYINQEKLTAEKFIDNPFDNGRSTKIYRTGDLARYLSDGTIEYLGRLDHQVKIRGFRIELLEIEAVLKKQEGIQEAVLVLREEQTGHKRLTAFLILKEEHSSIDKQLIAANSKKWLPDYMLPSDYIVLKEYPMTLNRKIDKSALANKRLDEIIQKYGADKSSEKEVKKVSHVENKTDIAYMIESDLMQVVAEILNISYIDMDSTINLGEYGFDSIRFTDLSTKLNRKYNLKVSPNLFYQYSTVNMISKYMLKSHKEYMEQYYSQKISETAEIAGTQYDRRMLKEQNSDSSKAFDKDPIAIIGIYGKMPGSDDLDEFWQNIFEEKDLITEIPLDRWDWKEYYGDPLREINKANSKWGGFITDVDKFDAKFFGISPKEAELMDPQQRLLLETVWKTIEDSGYKPRDLSGSRTGVFIGVTGSDFMGLMGAEIEGYTLTGIARSVAANRISYLLNLRGPSEPVDTACSSSLIAIHRAVCAIQNGECETAIAGGVNIMLTPFAYIAASKVGMLSEDGRCKAFDKSANGYVRGEGVGTILLKPLSKALADNDNIYGIIKATAENHGGRANSLTAPNVNAQADLIVSAYERAHIDPETITYIETHGTGTALGDPIEIDGLKNSFAQLYEKKGKTIDNRHFCGLGSVKTNIGHLEAAAGIAGVFKVLLAMKHKHIPGTVHLKEQNPYIDLTESPFYIVKHTQEWKQLRNESGDIIPRRAGVSSFGFGGSNAHVVIEEYLNDVLDGYDENNEPQLIVLSAKTEERLKEYSQQLVKFLKNERKIKDISLPQIAYTLQTGRQAMTERLAIIACSIEELSEKLTDFIKSENPKDIYRRSIKHIQHTQDVLEYDNLNSLARLWANGNNIDWQVVWKDKKIKRASLPSYPFEKERHWLENIQAENKGEIEKLHPMIDKNISTLKEEKFETTLSKKDFYLADHIVDVQAVLPGAAYIEMARAAAEVAGEEKPVKISDIIWSKPIILDGSTKKINIVLSPNNDTVDYEVISGEDQFTIHSQGRITYLGSIESEVKHLNIDEIKGRCKNTKGREECYNLFRQNKFQYGESLKVIQKLFYSSDEALSLLELPEKQKKNFDRFVLHPSLLDGALQTVAAIIGGMQTGEEALYLPFALKEVEILNSLNHKCYIYVTASENSLTVKKYNIVITDETGKEAVRLRDYSIRAIPKQAPKNSSELVYLQSRWQNKEIDDVPQQIKNSIIWVTGSNGILVNQLEEHNTVIQIKYSEEYKEFSDRLYTINPAVHDHYKQLISTLANKELLPDSIIYMEKAEYAYNDDRIDKIAISKIDRSIHSMFYLTKELINQKLNKELKILFIHTTEDEQVQQFKSIYNGLSGFAKSIHMENPSLICKVVEADGNIYAEKLNELISKELNSQQDDYSEVCFREKRRYVKVLEKTHIEGSEIDNIHLKENGVYIITGGSGKLGLIFAKHIAQRIKAKLVLVGKSELTSDKLKEIEAVKALGSKVLYVKADIGIQEDANRVVTETKASFGKINGVIHSAGVIQDSFLLKKTFEQLQKVLKPKVYGTIYLDEALKQEQLDFFVLFSSISAVSGNIGQCDYAYANSFMDYFSDERNELQRQGKRYGKAIAINWSLWEQGGMAVDEQVKNQLREYTGMTALNTEKGLKAFDYALKYSLNHLIVMEGDEEKILKHMIKEDNKAIKNDIQIENKYQEATDVDITLLLEKTEQYLKQIIAKATKTPAYKIDVQENLENYGIDSVMILNLNKELEEIFGQLSKTLFFEYHNISELAKYFIDNHNEKIKDKTGYVSVAISSKEVAHKSEEGRIVKSAERFSQPKISVVDENDGKAEEKQDEDIAIIGLSGRYPMANDIESFWENLKAGRDCISEIPRERWDYRKYFDEDKNKSGKTYSKWGGFIEDIDKFDPLFFNISPLEAEMLDPQERLFLQTVWHAVEDSGYTRDSLSKAKVGVFTGVMWGQYQLYGAEELEDGSVLTPASSYASIANRVSYYFNFRGPSITLDTMCSSSLTTIHLACESIKRGEIDMAVAGGVNLTLHPNKHIFLSQTKFASSDGRCRSFGKGGNGYVPGEGVGAILLKPLSKAVKDKDRVYAVIKTSAINHGGKTNGYTVPNPKEQSNLISEALSKSRINPRTISYIEAHGTGTALGDPIEITGLTKAFKEYTEDRQFCSIGSVKSNIGHCESAAGIAGITKLLMQFKYKQLVPSIHSDILNPNISFEDSPFYLQQRVEEWKRPVILENGIKKTYPRRAAISSFGAGGANAHIILEEYEASKDAVYSSDSHENIIVLSARNKERLREYAGIMADYLTKTVKKSEKVEKNHIIDEQSLIVKYLTKTISQILKVDVKEINTNDSISEYGFDEVHSYELSSSIKSEYGIEIPTFATSEYPSINSLLAYISSRYMESELDYLNLENICIESIAYTLQIGREAMEERIALIVSDIYELSEKLKAYADGKEDIEEMYYGSIKSKSSNLALDMRMLIEGEDGKEFIRSIISGRKFYKLAMLWTQGIEIDWKLLYDSQPPRRISLPFYPFAKERYWVVDTIKRLKKSNTSLESLNNKHLAFEAREIEILKPMNGKGSFYFQSAGENGFNIVISDENGSASIKLHNVKLTEGKDPLHRFFYIPSWEIDGEKHPSKLDIDAKSVLILYTQQSLRIKSALAEAHKGAAITEILLDDAFSSIDNCIEQIESIDTIYFLGGVLSPKTDTYDSEIFDRAQEHGVISLYRLLKALKSKGHIKNKIKLRIVTNNVHQVISGEATVPHSSSLFGFARSASREYPQLDINCIDVGLKDCEENLPDEEVKDITMDILTVKSQKNSGEIVLRSGNRYIRKIRPVELSPASEKILQSKGLYMVIGGTGNVGFKLCCYLAQTVNARLVVLGRSAMNESIKEKINQIKAKGGKMLYIQTDVSDLESMNKAVNQAKLYFGSSKINGVIHSAMNFKYNTIENLKEEELRQDLAPKVKGITVLRKAMENELLDFMLFFSSGEAFTGNVGWSSYAAGCVFEDTYGLFMNNNEKYPVKIINWGFWRGGNQEEFTQLLEAKGIKTIQEQEGMEAVQRVLGHTVEQIMAINVEDRVLELMGVDLSQRLRIETYDGEYKLIEEVKDYEIIETADNKKELGKISTTSVSLGEINEKTLEENVRSYIKGIFSKVIKIDKNKIDNSTDFSNYGVDSLIVTDIHREFERDLGKMVVTTLLENTTIDKLTKYLIENHKEVFEERVLGTDDIKTTEVQSSEIKSHKVSEKKSESHIGSIDIEVIEVADRESAIKVLNEYGDRYKAGTLNMTPIQNIKPSENSSLYHLMVTNVYNKKTEVMLMGQGTPILLIPAIGLTAPVWLNQFKDWAKDNQLIVIHHPGYGLSEVTEDISEAAVGRIYIDVLNKLGIKRPIHVIGSCFGGVAAQFIAKEYKERVASLTLIGSFYQNFGLPNMSIEDLPIEAMIEGAKMISGGINTDFGKIMEHAVTDEARVYYEKCRELLLKSQCVNPLVVMRYITQILSLSAKEWLPRITAPTLCIAGDLDTIVAPEISKYINSQIPDSRYEEVAGAGHYPFLSHNIEFNQKVIGFISEQESKALKHI